MTAPEAGTAPVRLVIADDEALIRDSLRLLLDARPDLHVVAAAADGQEAVAAAAAYRPDVVLMDVRMPVLDGIRATALITAARPPRPAVLILTTFGNDDYLHGALRAGASGFVLKRADPDELAQAVRTVAHGQSLVLPQSSRVALTRPDPAGNQHWVDLMGRLTAREREVLRLMTTGRSNAEIAAELFVGVQTVKSHVAAILHKLNARDRTQAVVIAYQARLA